MRSLNVHFLPKLVEPDKLRGSTCVVIDVLRATTTIIHALAAGAKEIIPCLEIDDARQLAARLPRESYVLGGERRGGRIEGFDLGNSPSAYTRATVGGKSVIFTTTNGTRALQHCIQADEILVAAFVNHRALVEVLHKRPRIQILCSGTDGGITQEDVLVAGGIVDFLATDPELELNDEARIAWDAWPFKSARRVHDELRQFKQTLYTNMTHSKGGRNLVELGMEQDIVSAAHLNRFTVVPHFAGGKITPLVAAS